jgi:hypothetical protein
MMNQLYIGPLKLPRGGFLYIDDEVPDVYRSRVFDPTKNSFNPLANIEYKAARQLANVLYTLYPQGENTLTVRNGRRALLRALLTTTRLDLLETKDEEVQGMVDDLLISPVIRHCLTDTHNLFSFSPTAKILVRLNRAEIGEFDALAIGLVLMATYPGQIVVPDLGFYGRDGHSDLIRQGRLIAGIHSLSELPLQLRKAVLSVRDVHLSNALYEDAETFARYNGKQDGTVGFSDYVHAATS